MIRGGNILITALFSVFFLKRILYRQHITGLMLAFIGFFIIGLTTIIVDSGSITVTTDALVVGIVLLIIGWFFSSAKLMVEEKFFQTMYLHPNQLMGY